jgi:hypothetical protein
MRPSRLNQEGPDAPILSCNGTSRSNLPPTPRVSCSPLSLRRPVGFAWLLIRASGGVELGGLQLVAPRLAVKQPVTPGSPFASGRIRKSTLEEGDLGIGLHGEGVGCLLRLTGSRVSTTVLQYITGSDRRSDGEVGMREDEDQNSCEN